MTEGQKRLRELLDQQSRDRQRAIELSRADKLDDELRAELDGIETRSSDTERQIRAARLAVDEEDDEAKRKGAEAGNGLDPEARARLELRGKASLGSFLVAALRGRAVTGAEAELQQAAGVDGIPTEIFDTREVVEARARREGVEHRAISPAPSTTEINLDPIRPAVFAPSIADRLMIDMPMVESGTYASGTIGTSVTADAVKKSAAVPETAAAITVQTTTPHRVGASLGLALEDVAAVGQANFEAVLRDNVSLALSAELDNQLINGDGSTSGAANNLTGIFERLTNPSAPAAQAESWTRFLAIQSGGIDGLWATELEHVGIVCNPETYRLAAATFQGSDAEDSAAMYMKRHGADFWTNARMPDKATHIAQGILCRKGRMGLRTAVAPHWGYMAIDDVYSGANKGERYFTVSVLVGDVILVQPDAYAQVAFRVST